MKYLLFINMILLTLNTHAQIIHRADSLYMVYERGLKKKKPIHQLVIQTGLFNHAKTEPRSYITKIDSLKNLSIAAFKGYVEVAVFDDFNPAQIFTIDTCYIFKIVENKKTDFLLNKGYTKSKAKGRRAKYVLERKIEKFEILLIKMKKFSYFYRVADEKFDFSGKDLSAIPFFLSIRQILDMAYLLAAMQ